ncbi:DUF4760 domain-containing protein [Pseudothioclava nitratireducens]|uniref:DUF4760 domain-containing protein n=1 Tax=Pseudothioclava nitratireducens TaxID=1928646 RepID=UPI0023DBD7DD|nr:DUF4760 domain-containing protein [Defluviimonas nitratireducens]MDF1618956.1 DUF4760 domain-containing protein [Defluviimonas nitratireducens]
MWQQSIGFFIEVISTILIFVGLLVAAYQIHQTRLSLDQSAEHHKQANIWNRKVAAQQALDQLKGSPVLSKLQSRFRYIDHKEVIPLGELRAAFEADPDLQPDLYELLNSYEKLARGVNLGIYDEEVIRVGRRGAMSKAYVAFREVIDARRTDYGAPNAWLELERLVLRWEAQHAG